MNQDTKFDQFHTDSSSNYDWGSSEPALHPEKGDPESVEYSDSYSDDYEVDRLDKSFK